MGYFSSLFKSETPVYQDYHVPNLFSILEDHDVDSAAAPIMGEEIKRVVFSMKPLKAPGTDGLHAIFINLNGKLLVLLFASLLLIFLTRARSLKKLILLCWF